jgi:bacteriocin-like protein
MSKPKKSKKSAAKKSEELDEKELDKVSGGYFTIKPATGLTYTPAQQSAAAHIDCNQPAAETIVIRTGIATPVTKTGQ